MLGNLKIIVLRHFVALKVQPNTFQKWGTFRKKHNIRKYIYFDTGFFLSCGHKTSLFQMGIQDESHCIAKSFSAVGEWEDLK